MLSSFAILQPAQSAKNGPGTVFTIDAAAPAKTPESGYLQMGSPAAGTSPRGSVLSVNSSYLTMDGKPWLPVMGEFHYSRYPERYWEEELLKMKAGGVEIVSTYVFWIHHEEVEGEFDWTGQRDLRRFVQLCGKHGLYVYPRIGPWGHGEVRNGGFPDWLLQKGPTRVSDPVYLSYVRRLYDEVGMQMKGLLWKDGGPVIGLQLENEYANRAPNAGAGHILKLKQLAIAAGLDVPLYTVTGWDNAVYPTREVIPVFGGYPDEPWSGSVEELPPDTQGVYQFHEARSNKATGILQGMSEKAEGVPLWHYPRLTAELGAGVQVTYHRRVRIDPEDISPIAITALGSGVNLLGYYMFQGGENPEGKRTTLQESQATGYPNDLPVKSYDFEAPLREFGQMNGSFRRLKVIHQFLQEFGSQLAPMTAALPDVVPSGPRDTTTLRVAARSDGERAFLFFNNYLRNYPLPEQKAVQVMLKLRKETVSIPRNPVDIPSQSAFIWPVNLDLGGALLKYAMAEPFAKIENGGASYYFFMACRGIEPEFAFDAPSVASLHVRKGRLSRDGGRVYASEIPPSMDTAIEFRTQKGTIVRIVVLTTEEALNSWKVSIRGKEHLLITAADVFDDGEAIHLRSGDESAFSFALFPDRDKLNVSVPVHGVANDGVFARYTVSVKPHEIHVQVEKIREAQPSPPQKMGPVFEWRGDAVAEAPDDADFARAAVWRVKLPSDACKSIEDVLLKINYVGDVARLYAGDRLLVDNFYNGESWEIGLKRFAATAATEGLRLEVLPLRNDAPIYLPKAARPDFEGQLQAASVESIVAAPEYDVLVTRAK